VGEKKIHLHQACNGVKPMSISKSLFVAAFSFCALGNLQANSSRTHHPKRHYLDEQAISVTKDGIVVETKNGPVRIKTLRSDENGVFIYGNQDLEKNPVPYKKFHCPFCPRVFYSDAALSRHIVSQHGHR
jgi:hypothetical protein